jgi:hypothetical protein
VVAAVDTAAALRLVVVDTAAARLPAVVVDTAVHLPAADTVGLRLVVVDMAAALRASVVRPAAHLPADTARLRLKASGLPAAASLPPAAR